MKLKEAPADLNGKMADFRSRVDEAVPIEARNKANQKYAAQELPGEVALPRSADSLKALGSAPIA
jgi:hypothetical protein